MNNNINLADIYVDFFEPSSKKALKEEDLKNIDINLSETDIEKLYITE